MHLDCHHRLNSCYTTLHHLICFGVLSAWRYRLSSAALAAVSNPQRANYSAADVVLLSGCGLQEVRTWTVCMSYNMFVIIFEERVIATVVHNENTHTLVLRAVVRSKKRLSYSTSTVVISIVSCVVIVEGVLLLRTSPTDPSPTCQSPPTPPPTHTPHTHQHQAARCLLPSEVQPGRIRSRFLPASVSSRRPPASQSRPPTHKHQPGMCS